MSTKSETNELSQLKTYTVVVADTGEINAVKKYRPQDATTNPSLIKKASEMEEYQELIEEALSYARSLVGDEATRRKGLMNKLFVNFGAEILRYVPGRVSTEVNAHLSFDAVASIREARDLIALYEKQGIDRKRVLIKLASTWEGVEAAKVLEKEGIHCNMTLMFSLSQAAACFEAGATLTSPFVGRILDWYKKNKGVGEVSGEEDPGVTSVRNIYSYLKQHGYKTQIMGASFRNKGEIIALAGCDLLTISPDLLEELTAGHGAVPRVLSPEKAREEKKIAKIPVDESSFRWHLNEDQMATEKLSDGIRKFYADYISLENELYKRL